MEQQLNVHAFSSAGAVVSAVSMLLLGIGLNVGIYEGAAQQMAKWHLVFSPSLGGIIGGMIEGAIVSYAFLYLFGWVYNRISTEKK